MINAKRHESINNLPDTGIISSSWLKMIAAAHNELGGDAYKEWPYLVECVREQAVDRKYIKPMVDASYKRYGFLYLGALARFINPAGTGSIFTGMMNAPTIRHGVAYLANESSRLDGKLEYNFGNHTSENMSQVSTWVIAWEYSLAERHQREISHIVQVAGIVKYFGMLHGEPPLASEVWVELDLPYKDPYLLEKALGVPVTFTDRNCIHVASKYASRQSLHSHPDVWAEIALSQGGITPKHWADRLALLVLVWDFSVSRPTVDEAASQLNLTGATLRNKLKAGGYVVKDVMKNAEMRRVRTSLRNGMSLAQVQKLFGYSNLRDLKANYKKYIDEDITKAKRQKVKDTWHYM